MPYNTSRNVVEKVKRYLAEMHAKRVTISWPTRDAKALSYQLREALEACRHHSEYTTWHDLKLHYSIGMRKGHVEAIWRDDARVERPQGLSRKRAERCPSVSSQGLPCTLVAGHSGEHQALMPSVPTRGYAVPAEPTPELSGSPQSFVESVDNLIDGLSKKFVDVPDEEPESPGIGQELVLESVGTGDRPLLEVIGGAIKYGAEAGEIYFPDARLKPNDLEKLWRYCQQSQYKWKIIDQDDAGLTLTKRDDLDEMLYWQPEGSV